MAGPAASPASSISITPLSGSQSGSRALCHLLEFDDAKILLDCGINASREEFTVPSSSSSSSGGSSKKSVRLDQEREEELERERIEYLDRLKMCVACKPFHLSLSQLLSHRTSCSDAN
jgi:hypothetical protein